jgi:hypothetical protein
MAVFPAGDHNKDRPGQNGGNIFNTSSLSARSEVEEHGTTTSTSISTEQKRLQGKAHR